MLKAGGDNCGRGSKCPLRRWGVLGFLGSLSTTHERSAGGSPSAAQFPSGFIVAAIPAVHHGESACRSDAARFDLSQTAVSVEDSRKAISCDRTKSCLRAPLLWEVHAPGTFRFPDSRSGDR